MGGSVHEPVRTLTYLCLICVCVCLQFHKAISGCLDVCVCVRACVGAALETCSGCVPC